MDEIKMEFAKAATGIGARFTQSVPACLMSLNHPVQHFLGPLGRSGPFTGGVPQLAQRSAKICSRL